MIDYLWELNVDVLHLHVRLAAFLRAFILQNQAVEAENISRKLDDGCDRLQYCGPEILSNASK